MIILKDEADFQTHYLDHVRNRGGVGFKISDSDIRLKPCDCFVTLGGETFWVELKYRGFKKSPNVLYHQENACKRVWKSKGKYFFAEYDARTHEVRILTGYVPPEVELSNKTILEMLGLDDFMTYLNR